MLFSVLIANYNNSRFLKTALDSVLQQSYTSWEIVLVDDGSTDNFNECIAPYLAHKSIRVFRNENNMGCGFTKHRCAEKASGTLMAFLDPDDALTPDALQEMVYAHHAHPDCSLISSTHFVCDETLKPSRVAEYTSAVPNGVPYLFLSDGRVHHFASFKRNAYLKTEGISAKYRKAVDQDLYYKLEETGKLFFISKPLYLYRIHKGAISNEGQQNEAQKIHYSIIEEACLRRIGKLDKKNPEAKEWAKKYRTRYYKVKIFNSFRRRNWPVFFYSMAIYPFVGGLSNLLAYANKIPKEGLNLFKQSFIHNYEIKP